MIVIPRALHHIVPCPPAFLKLRSLPRCIHHPEWAPPALLRSEPVTVKVYSFYGVFISAVRVGQLQAETFLKSKLLHGMYQLLSCEEYLLREGLRVGEIRQVRCVHYHHTLLNVLVVGAPL